MTDEQTKKPNPVGCPRQYKSVEEMEADIEAYFEKCLEEKRPYTITGLANALDLTRQGLINYAGRDEFIDTIRRAKGRVHQYVEESLFTGKANGPIFNLKNNFGWFDKSEYEHTGKDGGPIETKMVDSPPQFSTIDEWVKWKECYMSQKTENKDS